MGVLLVAVVLHIGPAGLYEALRPEPPPRLTIIIERDAGGDGTVLSTPDGIRCGESCITTYESGTTVELLAVLGENSTFMGFSEVCVPTEKDPLACQLELAEDTEIVVRFGEVPDEIEVALEDPPEPEEEEPEEMAVSLPDEEQLEELALADVPEPEPEPIDMVIAPPPPPEPPPPQPQPEDKTEPEELELAKEQMKAVEVPDENEVEEAPEDATFLSDKDRDVAEETHAKDTNLERASDGETPFTEESDVQSEDIGAAEDEIAQLEATDPTTFETERVDESPHTGEDEVAVGATTGEGGEGGEDGQEGDGNDAEEPGVMAMRGVQGRGAPGGPPIDEDPVDATGGKKGKRGKEGKRGIKTQLDQDDYKRIVGKDKADEEVQLARRKQSKRKGRFERKQAAVKAALENFTPEVKPGNQTALKTRAAPFAVYIAGMHRKIHELWGFGFLEELDGKSASHELNDWELGTRLEIAINPDGTIHKINIAQPSGVLMFDVAAIDAVLTGEPYDAPPEKIRSVDGRAWMHWDFHRDWRQCGTFGAQPFILTSVSEKGDSLDDSDLARRTPRKRAGKKEVPMPTASAPAGDPAASARANSQAPAPDDPRARHAANLWLTGFTKSDLAKMTRVSGTPFRSGGDIVANSPSEVSVIWKTVIAETKQRVIRDWKILSPAEYRKVFGALPGGVEPNHILMVVQVPGEQFTLVLSQDGAGEYRIIAFNR